MAGDLIIDFFDVGQGDGTLIQFPNGKTMLVDMGSKKNRAVTMPDVIAYCKGYEVDEKTGEKKPFTPFMNTGQTLDYLVLTHGHGDHNNMLMQFLKELSIATVTSFLYGGMKGDYGISGNNVIEELTTAYQPPPKLIQKGKQIPPFDLITPDVTGGVQVRVLAWNALPSAMSHQRKNTNSVVLQLLYAGFSVILTGDATRDTEMSILKAASKDKRELNTLFCDVLKGPHHGSTGTSYDSRWISQVNPSYVIFSADRHGALDSGISTGYKHVRQLAISIIQAYATKLAKDCEEHPYVAAYVPKDYEDYNDPSPKPKKLTDPYKGQARGWNNPSTRLGIFTTLGQIDAENKKNEKADLGLQYQVRVNAAARRLTVYSTEFKTNGPAKKPGAEKKKTALASLQESIRSTQTRGEQR